MGKGLLVLVAVTAAVGCGGDDSGSGEDKGAATTTVTTTETTPAATPGETTDVAGGVASLNRKLNENGIDARILCPASVEGGEGQKFECKLASEGKSVPLTMQVQREGGELVVDVVDQADFEAKLQQVIE